MANTNTYLEGMIYPRNSINPVITSEFILGGCHTFTSRADLNSFLSKTKLPQQEIGTLIHLKTNDEDKFYQLTKLAYLDKTTFREVPAEIEEITFSDSTSAYTYSSYTISDSGEVVFDEPKTFIGNSKDAIEHLFSEVEKVNKQIELVNRKATLYDASETDAIKITFDAPYTNQQSQENMSGHTGVHLDTAYIDLGDIDD